MSFRWEITVRERNHYGDRYVSSHQVSILAATRAEVTEKVRVAFDSTYDDFRMFWSHDWVLNSMAEESTGQSVEPNTGIAMKDTLKRNTEKSI